MLQKRVEKLLDALPDDFEAALIQTEVSRFYLLDFDAGDAGVLLVLPDKLVYLIDSRYIETAQQRVTNAEVVLETDRFKQLGQFLQDAGAQKVYLENSIPVALFERTKEKLPGVSFDISPRLSRELETLRRVKDEEEIARVERAQEITDACFSYILPMIEPGRREIDLALEMEHFMRSHGAQQVAFDTIFVGGKNSSLPHGHPGDYRLQKGDLITLDFGARVQGYCADMTRTVALGEVDGEKKEIYELVLQAHLAGIAAAQGGKKANEVDAVARTIIAEAGYGEYFGHGLGHAVGIEVHEGPAFSPRCDDVVLPGMLMTVEPGCYLPGRFGCRIEDTVLIETGGCRPLPKSPKNLLIL